VVASDDRIILVPHSDTPSCVSPDLSPPLCNLTSRACAVVHVCAVVCMRVCAV
jgi:hypothetical protein